MNQLQAIQFSQSEALLSTKLTAPRLRAPLIMRPSLLARLESGIERKLTLVSAPAGSGKSTLVSQWFSDEQFENTSDARAWISLDAGDNDPVRFGRYLVSACKAFDADLGEGALALLSMQQPSFEAALTVLINELAQLEGRHILVLEDYHFIASPQVHGMILFLLDHLPESLHLMILTRHDPPLPLARLRTRQELNELSADDLRFTLAECKALLEQSLPVTIPPEAVASLYERTEGWIAALRLVVLALQGKVSEHEILEFLANFSGGHEHILEYLVEEVLYAQPLSTQQFLLQTTFLNRLTGTLCNAVTERTDCALLLEELERANLFLVSIGFPSTSGQQWYRYHGLFAEAMNHHARRHFDQRSIDELYGRATLWYEQHGLLSDALECTLINGDYGRAATLLEEIIAPQLVQNQFHNLRRWLQQLPPEVMQSHPQLCLTFAISILFTSERFAPATHDLIEPPLTMAEELWRTQGNRHKLGETLAFRSLVSWFRPNPTKAIAEAREALSLLPDENAQWRGICLIFVAFDELLNGRLHHARQELLTGLALNEKARNTYGILDSLLLLGRVSFERGELRSAEAYYHQALTVLEQKPITQVQSDFRRGRALAGLAALEYEWNHLERAKELASEAIAISTMLEEEDLRVESTILLTQLLHASGERDEAQAALLTLMTQIKQPRHFAQIQAMQMRIALETGDSSSLRGWAGTPAHAPLPTLQRQSEAILCARMKMAQNRNYDASTILDEWLAPAREEGRGHAVLEMLILATRIAHSQSRMAEAQQWLCEAVELAQPHANKRLFLEGSKPIAELLRMLLRESKGEALVAYVQSLLLAFANEGAPSTVPTMDAALLVEPLSGQERRILRLLAADLSYPEIAAELVVSVNTVKTHVKNVYGKLGVHSREDASALAHQLQLL